MKKTALSIIVVALLLALPLAALAGEGGQARVDVCHIQDTYDFGFGPEPVGLVITIADPAYQSHLDHGDPGDYFMATLADGSSVCKEFVWTLIETVSVLSTSQYGATSTSVLAAGGLYAFKASGTWTQYGNTMDAEYSRSSTGTVYDGHGTVPVCGACGVDWGDLQIDGVFVNWGPYDPGRTYWLETSGTGAAVNFRIYEGYTGTNTVIPAWYTDNTGSLTVEIYAGH